MQISYATGFLTVLAATSLAGCSPMAGMPPLPPPATTQYQLDAGDDLRINAYGLDGFSNNYVVSDKGVISLPLIGDVQSSGRTVDQVQQAIRARLSDKKILVDPVVNVQINQYRPYYVVGEVKKPGEYPFRPGMSVLNAISTAGGYTFRAKTSKVSITRRVDDRSLTATAAEGALIRPGDTIRVYESWF